MQQMWEYLLASLKTLFSRTALTSEDIINIIFSLLLALTISFIISQIYKYTHYGMNFEQTFMIALVLLGPIVAAVMLFIQGSLVISLGLVGSLSIIRFRTPVKDSLDMIYIFWVAAVGIGAGTYNWTVTVIFSSILLLAIFILQFIKYGHTHNRYFVLVINGNLTYPLKEVEQIIRKYTSDARIRSHEIEDEKWEAIFEIRFIDLDGAQSKKFLYEIQALDEVYKVSLLAPQLALPV